MPVYSGISPEQKNTYQVFSQLQRAWCIMQASANNLGAAVDNMYNGQIVPLSVTGVDLIPHIDAYAGSQSLSASDGVTIESHIQGVQTNYNTSAHRQLWAKAAGGGNLNGGT